MFRMIALSVLSSLILPTMLSCGKTHDPVVPDPPREEQTQVKDSSMPETIKITISGKTLPVKLENNKAARALVEALREAPVTYEAHDYGGFERVGPLGRSLPSSDTQTTTQAGDVILYSSNQIVLFYGSNSWSYTRLGKIQYGTLDELKSFLKAGEGNISVSLSL
jgi:hypothetical protein